MDTTRTDVIKSLTGRRVRLKLSGSAGGQTYVGKLVGTLDAADGMVVFLEPDDAPGTTFSCNHQHVAEIGPA